MNKKDIFNTIQLVREYSKKRNFTQGFDLIFNLKTKIKSNPVEMFSQLPIKRDKKLKICALIDKELSSQAKGIFDTIILKDDFENYKDKSKLKQLAKEHTFFVAQANLMAQVAATFGKVLGPKGKMPNPKAECVIPQKITNLQPLYDKLQNTVKLSAKTEPIIKCSIGQETMKDDDLAENVFAVYNTLAHNLPGEEEEIKSVFLKLTMSPAIKIGLTKQDMEKRLKEKESKSKKSKKNDKEEVKKDAITKE